MPNLDCLALAYVETASPVQNDVEVRHALHTACNNPVDDTLAQIVLALTYY